MIQDFLPFGQQNLTLFQLNQQIKEVITDSFPEDVWVIAEIASINVNRQSGHCYLELIDKNPVTGTEAKARANIWSSKYRIIKRNFEAATGQMLRQGLKILVSATIKFHETYGFSLDINDIDIDFTMGDVARQRQESLQRLQAEGFIELNKSLAMPDVPKRIAIISSQTAAGYQDFIHQLTHNPEGYVFNTTLFQATMQGKDAAASVAAALERIENVQQNFDVTVIIRGGGAVADLSAFDDYDLAVAVATHALPVLTGIGHERDESIVDMVAHTKLKTPTAVAGYLVETTKVFENQLDILFYRLATLAGRNLKAAERNLDNQAKFLLHISRNSLQKSNERVNLINNNVKHLAQQHLAKAQSGLALIETKINFLDPASQLKRGYSLTYVNNRLLTTTSGLNPGDIIETRLFNGKIESKIQNINQP